MVRMAPPRVRTANIAIAQVPDKRADAIYGTPEYRAWRAIVIHRAGYRCQDCGRSKCRLFADHIIELKDGGAPFDPNNGRSRCGRCHSLKTHAVKRQREG